MYEVTSHANAMQLAGGQKAEDKQQDPAQPPPKQQLPDVEAMKQRLAAMDMKASVPALRVLDNTAMYKSTRHWFQFTNAPCNPKCFSNVPPAQLIIGQGLSTALCCCWY